MKLLSLIGYSGSGKTHFITTAIKQLKRELNLSVAVIKNVHKHDVDSQGKDSYEFSNAGAEFSIIKNKYSEIAVFLKKDLSIDALITWILKLSEDINLVFVEGFRDLNIPGILCVDKFEDIEHQLNSNIKMISGLYSTKNERVNNIQGIPVVDVKYEFHKFIEIFGIA